MSGNINNNMVNNSNSYNTKLMLYKQSLIFCPLLFLAIVEYNPKIKNYF